MKKIISMILVLTLVLCGMTVAASAAEGESVNLFSGEAAVPSEWNAAVSITLPAAGLTAADIVEGGYLSVTHSGPTLYLAFQDSSDWSAWYQTGAANEITEADGVCTSIFTYDQIAAAYTGNWETLTNIFVSGYGYETELIVYDVTWYAPAAEEGGEEEGGEEDQPAEVATIELFNGEHTISAAWTTQDNYTTVWGGSFDPANIVPGGAFFITYSGEKDQIELVLNGPSWFKIPVSSISEVEGGYVATVTYDDIVAIYGSDFSQLGAVCPSSMETTEPMVIKNVTWGPATGVEGGGEEEEEEPADPNTIVLFEGEFSTPNAWDAGIQVNTNNNDWAPDGFDVVNTFVPGSYFTITYTGTAKEAILVFMDWDVNKWIAVAPIHTEVVDNKYFVSYYSYASMVSAYGSSDFSGVDAVCAGSRQSTGTTVVTNVSWTSVAPDFSNPNTGDAFSIGAAVIATIASGLGLGITATKRRGE